MKRIVPLLLSLAVMGPAAARAQAPDSLPPGVTAKMVTEGASLFTGPGICIACHGPDGKGIPNLGANLTDTEWLHSDGSYEGILKTIRDGVGPDESSTGTAMPPKGGSSLTDEQLKAVAAYVWSLRRSK